MRIPDHPLVKETIANCLYEAMDLDGLRAVLAAIHDGAIRTVAIDTPEPSPFSHEILNSNPYAFLDDAPLEERRARAVQMRRTLPDDSPRRRRARCGRHRPGGRRSLAAHARRRGAARSAAAVGALIPAGQVAGLADFETLAAARRAATLTIGGRDFWVPAERLDLVLRVYPHATFDPPIAPPQGRRAIPESPEACAAEILRGWFECSGPLRASDLAQTLAMPRELVDQALAQLEAEGQILRGRFTPNAAETEIEWCHRNLLARIHRLTIGRLRREIEPVTTAAFFAFLNRWQHRAPGTQLHGVDGTLADHPPIAGLRVPRGRVGIRSAAAPRGPLSSRNTSTISAWPAK